MNTKQNSSRFTRLATSFVALFILLSAFPTLPRAAVARAVAQDQDCNADAPNAKEIGTQVGWRVTKGTTENLTGLIIAKYKAADKEYTDAQKLYNDAQVKWNAYIDAALLQMVEQQKGDLTDAAKKACEALRKYQSYVDEKTQSKGFLAALPVIKALVEWGIDLFDKHKAKEKAKRQSIAKALEPQVKLKTWAEIVKANNP